MLLAFSSYHERCFSCDCMFLFLPDGEDFTADDSDGKNWGDEPLAQTPGDGEQTSNGEPTNDGEGGNAEEGTEGTENQEGGTAEAEDEGENEKTEDKDAEDKGDGSYFCKTCQETSNETEDEHVKGRKHLKTVERLEKYGSLEAIAAEFQSSTCYLCNVNAVSKSQMQSHMQGAKHKARCASLELPPTAMDFAGSKRPPAKPESKAPTTVDLHAPLEQKPVCDVCNITLSSLHQLLQHLNGKRHKEVVVAMKILVSKVPPLMRPPVLRNLPKKIDGKPPLPGSTPPQGPAPRFTIAPQGPPALQGVKRPAAGGAEGGAAKKPKPGPGPKAKGLQQQQQPRRGPLGGEFWCYVCQVGFSAEYVFNQHLESNRHFEGLKKFNDRSQAKALLPGKKGPGGALLQGPGPRGFAPRGGAGGALPPPGGARFRAPAPLEKPWSSSPAEAPWRAPGPRGPSPTFGGRPLAEPLGGGRGLLGSPPHPPPEQGGGYGGAPSQQFSKLQLDLAMEISKLSQHLARPEFSQELSQQLSQHLGRSRALGPSDLDRPPLRESYRPDDGYSPRDPAPLLRDKGPLLGDSYEDRAPRRPALLGEARPAPYDSLEPDYHLDRRADYDRRDDYIDRRDDYERRPGIDSYGERRSHSYPDDYDEGYGRDRGYDGGSYGGSGDYARSSRPPTGGLLDRPPLLDTRY